MVGSKEVGVIWSIGQKQLFSVPNHMSIHSCATSLGFFITTLLTVYCSETQMSSCYDWRRQHAA